MPSSLPKPPNRSNDAASVLSGELKKHRVSPRLPYPFLGTIALLLAAYALPIRQLIGFALSDDIFSYILLVPFVSFYFYYFRSSTVPFAGPTNRLWSAVFGVCGAVAVVTYLLGVGARIPLTEDDRLAWQICGFVLFLWAAVFWFAGKSFWRTHLFALFFLGFLIPLPTWGTNQVEAVLQHASASAAAVFFRLSGTTFFRESTFFQLPGIAINVAPECSGIRSSLALLVTSVIASKVFLRSPLSRCLLVAAVLPLAVIRNGFRVFVIGELCVREGPQMIDSYIHRHGGPIFFVLSLIPFGALLWFLIKRQRITPPPALP